MTDGKKAFLDAQLFLRKLRRYLAKQNNLKSGQKSFRYITIAEPQGERHGNSWHLHILLMFDDEAPFISNEIITKLWGHGITSTHEVFDADGLALYFKAYLSDVEYEDECADEDDSAKPITVEKMVDGVSKQFIKGERLKYYPSGMNLYSSSRDMKKPVIEEMTNAKAMECIGDAEMAIVRHTRLVIKKKAISLIRGITRKRVIIRVNDILWCCVLRWCRVFYGVWFFLVCGFMAEIVGKTWSC